MQRVIERLIKLKKTISTMESCTGGALSSAITNVKNADDVFKFSAITYSNEFKIKMGVDPLVIDSYGVYSRETAREMSRNICSFSNSNYGVGITGKINIRDENFVSGLDNVVYISIYNADEQRYFDHSVFVSEKSWEKNKEVIVNFVIERLIEII